MNPLNIIPSYIIVSLLCAMSYWHGRAEDGWRIYGLIFNLMMGLLFVVLATMQPIFI